MSSHRCAVSLASFLLLAIAAPAAGAQTVTIDTSEAGQRQRIDGFGTCLSGTEGESEWFQRLYFDDLQSSILRFDITPNFAAPYSDFVYNSPWFGNDPELPGPEGNNVRTYTDAASYAAEWYGRRAPIAVMGPDINHNVQYFTYENDGPRVAGTLAQLGAGKRAVLGDFKLVASMWSPAPWLKVSSGNSISGQAWPLPVDGAAWPFIWGGNFSGGYLDTSEQPVALFDDSALGGSGPTTALTQFARSLAAYLRGFQEHFGVRLYAISIQNELNFEVFYNSCSYPLADMYIKALKAARAELDKYDDLREIRIMGPEDLLGGDVWGMWQYGGGDRPTHKNLNYLAQIAADPEAAAALDYFCIHGYAPDGVSSSGANPQTWQWWAQGWTTPPAEGIPADVKGFSAYGKKSWMTETSGEEPAWLAGGDFPSSGGFSIALKIHQALTAGKQSAWIYWQLSDGSDVKGETLTDATLQERSPKYVAAKHFFRHIRPDSLRVDVQISPAEALQASAYLHAGSGTLTAVLVNTSPDAIEASIGVPGVPQGLSSFELYTSSEGSLWQASTAAASAGALPVSVPGYGVVTVVGRGAPDPNAGTGGSGGTGAGASGGANPAGGSAGSGGVSAGSPGGGGATAATGGASGPGASGGPGAGGTSGCPDGVCPSDPAASPEDDGGCGCRSVGARRTAAGWALLLGLGALCRRRRSRFQRTAWSR